MCWLLGFITFFFWKAEFLTVCFFYAIKEVKAKTQSKKCEMDIILSLLLYIGWNIGITHVFLCINICRVPRMLFEHEADRPSVQHHPKDPASVNAMKQTCVIVILAYLPYSSPICTENAAKTLNCQFSYTGFL